MSHFRYCLLFALVFLSGCAVTHSQKVVQEAAKCKTIQLLNDDNKTLGTGVLYAKNKQVFMLTAGHVLAFSPNSNIYIRGACSAEKHALTGFIQLKGIDVAVLFSPGAKSDKKIIGWVDSPANKESSSLDYVYTEFFSEFHDKPKFFNAPPFPSAGQVVEIGKNKITFTMAFIHKGASGAPLLNEHGKLLGLITQRELYQGAYTGYAGLGEGVSYEAINNELQNIVSN